MIALDGNDRYPSTFARAPLTPLCLKGRQILGGYIGQLHMAECGNQPAKTLWRSFGFRWGKCSSTNLSTASFTVHSPPMRPLGVSSSLTLVASRVLATSGSFVLSGNRWGTPCLWTLPQYHSSVGTLTPWP